MISMLPLRPRPFDAPRRAIDVQAIREGLGFVWNRSILLGIMVLDLIAVIFAGATALLPVFATDILEVGPRGYGLLTASVEFGAMLMAGMFLFLPQVEKAGRALFLSVAAFGIATLLFGLSDWFILSLLAYMAVGMADEASVVMRMTTIQLVTPPELQGRVNSVNFLFAVSANELGAVESGFVGAAIGARWAVVTGPLPASPRSPSSPFELRNCDAIPSPRPLSRTGRQSPDSPGKSSLLALPPARLPW